VKKVKVIMTSHQCLQLSPRVYKIYTIKDKTYVKFDLSAKLLNKAVYFRFLNLSPKAKL
jgi:hypothetical protein